MINGIQQKGFILAVWLGFKCASVVTSYQYSNPNTPPFYLFAGIICNFISSRQIYHTPTLYIPISYPMSKFTQWKFPHSP